MSVGRKPPGPDGGLLLGNLRELRKDPFTQLQEYVRTYGDVVRLRFVHRPVYLLSHPDDIEYVLVSRFQDFVKNRAFRMAQGFLGQGLLLHEGELWRRRRALAMPAFRRERIAEYGRIVLDHTDRMLDSWQDQETVDIYQEMMALTLNVIIEALLGQRADTGVRELSVNWCRAVNHHGAKLSGLSALVPDVVPTPRNLQYRWAVHRVNDIISNLIAHRLQSPVDTGDLLSMLILARDEDGSGLLAEELLAEVKTMLFAGHETTALALSWALYLVATHPHVEAALQAELESVCRAGRPSYGDLPSLTFSAAVVMESLRLYPPAWVFGRQALTDFEAGGYTVPAGSTVVVSPWVMHRNPHYFDDPDAFRPERWLDGLEKRLPRYVYFPFGGGPRVCIGRGLALMEATLSLARIVQRFRLSVLGPDVVKPAPTMTARPNASVKAVLTLRKTVATEGGTSHASERSS